MCVSWVVGNSLLPALAFLALVSVWLARLYSFYLCAASVDLTVAVKLEPRLQLLTDMTSLI